MDSSTGLLLLRVLLLVLCSVLEVALKGSRQEHRYQESECVDGVVDSIGCRQNTTKPNPVLVLDADVVGDVGGEPGRNDPPIQRKQSAYAVENGQQSANRREKMFNPEMRFSLST